MAIVPSAGGGRSHATGSQTGEVSSRPASEDLSVTELKDLSPDSLSTVFKALVEQRRDELKTFHSTLLELHSAISAFHAAGLDGVTIEHADFVNLQRYGLYKDNKENEEPENVTYALLGIYNAVFVVRIHPENVIECHAQNANSKVKADTTNVAAHRFWYKTDKQDKPDFFQYDLKAEEDRIAFAHTVLQAAAVRIATDELKEFDVTSSRIVNLTKATTPPSLK